MGDPAKRRRRAKEKAKQARVRRSQSPWQIPPRQAELQCFVTANWRDVGLADILIFRPAPGSGFALACFLIDLQCLGVKDAFVRLGVLPSEVKQRFEEESPDGGGLNVVDLEFARGLIRGGIRWSHEHRFRLPRELDHALGMIGGVGDWHDADVSEFGSDDGKLHYIGTERGLRERLIDCTVEEFLDRDDVVYTLGPGADFGEVCEDDEYDGYDDESEDEPLSEGEVLRDGLAEQLADRVREWCDDHDQPPNPLLFPAASVMVQVLAELQQEHVAGGALGAGPEMERVAQLIDEYIASAPAPLRAPLNAAMIQVLQYMMLHAPKPETSSGVPPVTAARDPHLAAPGEPSAATAGEPRLHLVDEPRGAPTDVGGADPVAGKIGS